MFTNKYKYGLIDLSYLLNRNIFSCCRLYGIGGFTAGDVVRTIIQTINKVSRDHGITMDKCLLLNDTYSKEYNGYFRTKLLGGLYKTSRIHLSTEEITEIRNNPEVSEKEKEKAELNYFKDKIKKEAKKLLRDYGNNFGLPNVSVSGWEFDDLVRLSSILLMQDPESKPSIIISKDSDLQYALTPKLDYFKIPTAKSTPETITYSYMMSTVPREILDKGLGLYEYKSYVDSLGGGHNDMLRSKKPRINTNRAILKILEGEGKSVIEDEELFNRQLKTFSIQDFPNYDEAKDKLMSAFLSDGKIQPYPEFRTFSDVMGINTNKSFISKNYYEEFTGRFDKKLFNENNK